MYQWRKFEFFEEKLGGKSSIPEEVKGTIHFLVTVGEDEQLLSQQSAQCLKVFDLDKMQDEGSSTVTPDYIGILRIFTNQFPEAKITSFLVLEEAPPILQIAIGLDNGSIYSIKGDIARERITRFKLQVESHSSITGLGFRIDGQALQLFAVTPASISLFGLHNLPPRPVRRGRADWFEPDRYPEVHRGEAQAVAEHVQEASPGSAQAPCHREEAIRFLPELW